VRILTVHFPHPCHFRGAKYLFAVLSPLDRIMMMRLSGALTRLFSSYNNTRELLNDPIHCVQVPSNEQRD
jgi:hypothetical protein